MSVTSLTSANSPSATSLNGSGISISNSSAASLANGGSTRQSGTVNSSTLSLFQRCVQLTEKLSLVPGFADIYLSDSEARLSSSQSQQQADSELPTATPAAQRPDPVTLLWTTLRMGGSLCLLVNHLRPNTIKNANSLAQTQQNANLAKANVYYFLLACRNTLGFAEDDLFSISELYKDDTNGFVKVLHTVELVVMRLASENKLDDSSINRDSIHLRPRTASLGGAQSHRDKIVQELLETERKYVADLEVLHNYQVLLQDRELISVQDSRSLFANLPNLLDLQRKFLIGLEQVCIQPAESQMIGQLFVSNEEAFAVYGPYCANHSAAIETAVRLKDVLMKVEDVMEPTRQLQSFLIRPVQRICKYPLLLRELLRFTDSTAEDLIDDLNSGYATVSRVTSMINEINRTRENAQIAAQLARDVEDWKGFNIEDFGELLLDARIIMSRKGVEKDVHMFLFERILICCKEQRRERSSRGISRILSSGSGGRTYSLKGGVTIKEISAIVASTQAPNFALKVYYCDYDTEEMESFTLHFINEEPLLAWQHQIEQLLDQHRRRSAPVNARRSQTSLSGVADRPSSLTPVPVARSTSRRPSIQEQQSLSMTHMHSVSRRSSDRSETINSLDNAMTELGEVLRERVIVEENGTSRQSTTSSVSRARSSSAVGARSSSGSGKFSMTKLPPAPMHAPPPVPMQNSSASAASSSAAAASMPTPLSTPEPQSSLSQGDAPADNVATSTTMMKAKVHFGGDIFLIFVPAVIKYADLVRRLCDKLYENKAVEQRAQALRDWRHKVRYVDDDGDFITVRGDQDVAVAVKLALAGATTKRPVIHLHVD